MINFRKWKCKTNKQQSPSSAFFHLTHLYSSRVSVHGSLWNLGEEDIIQIILFPESNPVHSSSHQYAFNTSFAGLASHGDTHLIYGAKFISYKAMRTFIMEWSEVNLPMALLCFDIYREDVSLFLLTLHSSTIHQIHPVNCSELCTCILIICHLILGEENVLSHNIKNVWSSS